ncbi:MAG: DUF4917 family protein [Candidatus Levybacteria bacterium]|nr:DUF4917 family protein [Candidatus Levybacteria bacterium]
MTEQVNLLKYEDVLKKIEGKESNLLLGNGFNRSLGVNTSYSAIFQKMIQNDLGIYKDTEEAVKECDFDLEKFIGKLTKDINEKNIFLQKYVANKVKQDFMKATHEIVKEGIKNIYAEQNEGVFILLKHFQNYFTLNYDSFLYLLLLNFKLEKTKEITVAFKPTLKFIEEDMNEDQNNIYTEIKKARENGTVSIKVEDNSDSTVQSLGDLTKKNFISQIEIYSKSNNKNWKTSDIEKVVKSLLEEEKKNNILKKVDDGSKQLRLFDSTTEFIFDIEKETQNLFFLHGAFHIYKDGKIEKKITQNADNALYDKLEQILNDNEKEIICIFQSENKIEAINRSAYLKKALQKLSKLS